MDVCNGCHDEWMKFINLSDIATLNTDTVDYRFAIKLIELAKLKS